MVPILERKYNMCNYSLKFLLTIVSFVLCLNISAKKAEKVVVKILQPENIESNYYENDSIKITFSWDFEDPSRNEYAIEFTKDLHFCLDNKLDERVYIEWENARTNGKRVIFGEDSRLTANNKKEDEVVTSKSVSISRTFFKEAGSSTNPLGVINNWAAHIWGSKYDLPKNGEEIIDFLIPVRFSDGKTIDYKFKVLVRYINQANSSLVEIGMKEKEVKKLLGYPNKKENDKSSDVEKWYYTNNAVITFEKDAVINIDKSPNFE